jgi:hypothetical protein
VNVKAATNPMTDNAAMHPIERRLSGLAITLSAIAIGVALVAAPAAASHHKEGEGQQSQKFIRIEPAEHSMLAGDRVKLLAQVCETDGGKCRPAKSARWTFRPSELVSWTARRGAVTVIESRGEPGALKVTAKQDGLVGRAKVNIGETVEPVLVEPTRDDLFLYVLPERATVDLGALVRINTWGCPIDTASELGENGVPDGVDDVCEPVAVDGVALGDRDPLIIEAIAGPAALLRLWPPAGAAVSDGDVLAPQLITAAGVAVPRLTVRDRIAAGPSLLDVDGDGLVTLADYEMLLRDGVDLDGDGAADAADLALFAQLAPAVAAGDAAAE